MEWYEVLKWIVVIAVLANTAFFVLAWIVIGIVSLAKKIAWEWKLWRTPAE